MNKSILFILKIARLVLEADNLQILLSTKKKTVFFCLVEQMRRNRFKLRQRKHRFDIRKNLSW